MHVFCTCVDDDAWYLVVPDDAWYLDVGAGW